MKKIICKTEYDTETAELIKKVTFGEFGDPMGYEETLYKTPCGKFFLYTNGGSDSIHPEQAIKRMSAEKASERQSFSPANFHIPYRDTATKRRP